MLTPEERESIVNEAMERTLRILPEVMGNLMSANSMYSKLTKEFYEKNPEFKNHKDVVKEVVSKLEGADPTKSYEKILAEATPIIQRQIGAKRGLSMETLQRPSLKIDLHTIDNGEL